MFDHFPFFLRKKVVCLLVDKLTKVCLFYLVTMLAPKMSTGSVPSRNISEFKKLRRLLQRERHIKIELCIGLIILLCYYPKLVML